MVTPAQSGSPDIIQSALTAKVAYNNEIRSIKPSPLSIARGKVLVGRAEVISTVFYKAMCTKLPYRSVIGLENISTL